MLLERDRDNMAPSTLVQSINTGALWWVVDLDLFFRGRRREWYRIYREAA